MEPLTPSKRDSAFGLSAKYPSIATLMKSGGYETALIGKWHLGYLPEYSPGKNGFDYFFGIHSSAADYISHKGDGDGPDLYENDSLVSPAGYMTDLFSENAIRFISKKHDKPFFLTLTFNAPHWPWQGPKDQAYPDTMNYRNGGSPAIYAAMMTSLDNAIANILKTLDDEHLANQTLVIFTNDNGGERYSNNGGLAKGKATLWEGGIRVPAFVRWPGKIEAGTLTQQAAITMDWTATILAAGKVTPSPQFPLDGIDLMPLLTGKQKSIDRVFYWRTIQRSKQQWAVRMGEWKYLHDEKGEYLFDLTNDQGEKNDLKTSKPEILDQLKKKYADWEKTVLQPIPY